MWHIVVCIPIYFPAHYVDDLVDNFPSPVKNYDEVPDAVTTIRRALIEAEDHSMVYVSIGFLINLRDLLSAESDRELFAKKVAIVYIMGGQFEPESKTPEFNFGCGVWEGTETYSHTGACGGSAKEAIEHIPDSVPVRFVGFGAGEHVWTGGSLWSWCKPRDSLRSPCYRALVDWEKSTGNKTSQTWDPLTITAAASTATAVG